MFIYHLQAAGEFPAELGSQIETFLVQEEMQFLLPGGLQRLDILFDT